MNQKVRDAREKRAEDLVGEVENAKDDTQMFKAAKALHMKHQKMCITIKNDVCHNHKRSKRS